MLSRICQHSRPEQTHLGPSNPILLTFSSLGASPRRNGGVLWCFLVLFWTHVPQAGVRVALMALIDCLAVINGHMLSMHIVDILTQMRNSNLRERERGHLWRSTYFWLWAQHLGQDKRGEHGSGLSAPEPTYALQSDWRYLKKWPPPTGLQTKSRRKIRRHRKQKNIEAAEAKKKKKENTSPTSQDLNVKHF